VYSTESPTDGHRAVSIATYALGFLFYVRPVFRHLLFQCGAGRAAMIRLDGGTPTVGDGLRIANSRFWSIPGYAAMDGHRGHRAARYPGARGLHRPHLVVHAGRWAGRWPTTWSCLFWSHATSARWTPVSESASILRRLGENVIGQAGVGAAFAFDHMLVIICGIVLVVAPSLPAVSR